MVFYGKIHNKRIIGRMTMEGMEILVFNYHKAFWILVKGRSRITGNSIYKSWVNSVELPEGTVPSISRYFTIFHASWVKPELVPIYKPYISVLIYTVNDRGYRRLWWYERWGRGSWCHCSLGLKKSYVISLL